MPGIPPTTSQSPSGVRLAVGSALHGVMYVPFALTLACGAAGLALRINLVLLALLLPLLAALTSAYGALGAAAAWPLLHLAYVLFGGWFTHRTLMPGVAVAWLARDVGPPAIISLAFGFAGHLASQGPLAGASAAAMVVWGLAWCLLSWTAIVAASDRLRQALAGRFVESGA